MRIVLLVFLGRVRAGVCTLITCTLFPRGRSNTLCGRARVFIERGALSFVLTAAVALLGACNEMHEASYACVVSSLLPGKIEARAVLQLIVARGCRRGTL